MTTDTTRLNIERAREALARARAREVAAAVRAPRPADLSRLAEDQERRRGIDDRAEAFRGAVRERLGLGEYRGPGVPASAWVGASMSAPLCDADMCAPRLPAAFRDLDDAGESGSVVEPPVPVEAPEQTDGETAEDGVAAAPDAETAKHPDAADMSATDDAITATAEGEAEGEAPAPADLGSGLPRGYVAGETPTPPPAPKLRRKFLGLF